MFRSVVASARSSNVFLGNGARLYLDVGNHPEYATAECDTLTDLLAQDRAGERLVQTLADEATERLAAEGVEADIFVFKNNVDSAGNSFGCHENYLLARGSDLGRTTAALLPFLISRQLICGAGKVLPGTAAGEPARYALSQRAEVMWEGVSSATTRSRPMINTRDEPHADAERFRRLHVIVGDSNMSQATTLLKVGATDLVLRALEAGASITDLTPANEAQAIRTMSYDMTGRVVIPTNNAQVSALNVQRAYHQLVADHLGAHGSAQPHDDVVFDLWTRTLDAVESGNLDPVATEIDWIIKKRLLDRYADRLGSPADDPYADPRLVHLDLLYHDINPARGLFLKLERAGSVSARTTPDAAEQAMSTPPQTTRAKMRGEFVTAASAAGRDYTVDWSHLRLNDEPARTILCKDPFQAQDDRVDRMMTSIHTSEGR